MSAAGTKQTLVQRAANLHFESFADFWSVTFKVSKGLIWKTLGCNYVSVDFRDIGKSLLMVGVVVQCSRLNQKHYSDKKAVLRRGGVIWRKTYSLCCFGS